ncbi:hypothetical protein GE061_003399 [Apolygus lucorum]|uniref:C2H2-type domain-containing protein n=1 Tax=Apolygus lucorum TaxID=248454 RepID=A0A8S9X1W8_APOLU|nr:hypothetical protein GE061_003399 [Apolygus lucorum]
MVGYRSLMDAGTTNFVSKSSKTKFFCDSCSKVYYSQGGLYTHKRRECGKEPAYICSHCPYRTKHKHSLKFHVNSRHPEAPPPTFANSNKMGRSPVNYSNIPVSDLTSTAGQSQNTFHRSSVKHENTSYKGSDHLQNFQTNQWF